MTTLTRDPCSDFLHGEDSSASLLQHAPEHFQFRSSHSGLQGFFNVAASTSAVLCELTNH
eukprot:3125201-Amphidinium_carterae.1